MKKIDIVTVGSALKDITFFTNQGKIFCTPQDLVAQKLIAFEYGAKININEAYFSLGGGASNTAVSFSKLGLKAAAVIRIGKDDDAQEIGIKFKEEGIDGSLIQVDKALHTGISFILGFDRRDKDHVVFTYRGANNNLDFNEQKLKNHQCDWVYLTSLSGNNWPKVLRKVFNYTAKNKIKVVWNPGAIQIQAGKNGLSDLLKQTQVLILNKDEAIELVLSGIKIGRRHPQYLNRPLYLLNILRDWGPKIVVITEGKNGAYAFEGKKIHKIKAIKTKVADTIGVGDAFGSAFLAGLIHAHGKINQALKWGIVNSASVCTKVGAQNGLLKLNEIIKKIN